MTQSRDVELLQAVARGERAALGELYVRLVPQMLAHARRILGTQHEAEDVIHDVFLEAWRRAAHYDQERAQVRTWFLLRVRSRALDRLRRARTLDAFSLAALLLTPAPQHQDARPASKPRRDILALQLELDDLPHEQRHVLELGYFAGYSHEEIASQLAIPIGTVKSRTSRAIARLRRRLRAHRALGS